MLELFSLLDSALLDSAVGSAEALGLVLSPPPNMFLPLFRLGDIFGDENFLANLR